MCLVVVKASRVPKARPDRRGLLEKQGHQEAKVRREIKGIRAIRGSRASRVFRGLPEMMEHKVFRVNKDCRGLRVPIQQYPDLKAPKVYKGFRGPRALIQLSRAHRGHKGIRAFKASKGLPGPIVPFQGHRDPLEIREHKVFRVSKAFREFKVSRGLLELLPLKYWSVPASRPSPGRICHRLPRFSEGRTGIQ